MAAAQNQPNSSGDSKTLTTVIVPVVGVALIVILVIVIAGTSDEPKPTVKDEGTGGGAVSLKTLTDGTDPNAEDAGLKDLGGGLKIRDLKEGSGPECPPGAKVVAHYTGWLTNGKVFDSSRKKGEPIEFALTGVIAGWQQGIPGMKVGGVRKLVIPPDLGYGARGAGNDIPGGATLIFEVELVAIK